MITRRNNLPFGKTTIQTPGRGPEESGAPCRVFLAAQTPYKIYFVADLVVGWLPGWLPLKNPRILENTSFFLL
jgi:hypothetical protein